ncbi:MAG: zinc-dependent alcohol dehydrogenase family protein [Opitutae bacterium]|nr:zinc-dependent alcohol dehydrogenase family protein [Opitutae bacterium]MDA8823710.1 zinc-dependent alcohol dehydrogenase family protein [Opitutales bacterium]
MKTIILDEHGTVDGFKLSEIPNPIVLPGHVILKVCASSVNPVDCKIRNGMLAGIGPELPGVLHGDVAGVISEVGEGVEDFQVDDEVYGCIGGFKGMPGVLCEYALADARLLSKKPISLSMKEAAVLPLIGITAWNALIDRGQLSEGKRVLVHAGTGGVGHFALQLAKAMGAEVHTTISSPVKEDLALQMGADCAINYSQITPEQYVKEFTEGMGYDLVFDTVGGICLDQSFEAAKEYGTVVSIAARANHDLSQVHVKSLSLHVVFMLLPILKNQFREKHGEILSKISSLVDDGKIKPLLHEERFSFEDVGQAHQCWEEGGVIGKISLENTW